MKYFDKKLQFINDYHLNRFNHWKGITERDNNTPFMLMHIIPLLEHDQPYLVDFYQEDTTKFLKNISYEIFNQPYPIFNSEGYLATYELQQYCQWFRNGNIEIFDSYDLWFKKSQEKNIFRQKTFIQQITSNLLAAIEYYAKLNISTSLVLNLSISLPSNNFHISSRESTSRSTLIENLHFPILQISLEKPPKNLLETAFILKPIIDTLFQAANMQKGYTEEFYKKEFWRKQQDFFNNLKTQNEYV